MNKKLAYVSTILLASILVSSCGKYPKVEEKPSPEFEKVLAAFKDDMPTENLSSSMKKIIDGLEKKCDANDDASCSILSYVYSNDHKAQRDMQKAVNIWFDLCKKGHLDKCRTLQSNKDLFEEKDQELVNKAYKQAIASLKEKCKEGSSPDSCYEIAVNDIYSDKNKTGFEDAVKACEQGSSLACEALSNNRSDVWISNRNKYDEKEAVRFRKLYKKNLKHQCELGNDKYCLDSYVAEYQDESSSEKKQLVMSKIHERCQNGDISSCYSEGKELFAEDNLDKNSVQRGLDALNKACDKDNVYACTILYYIYKDGKNIEKDESLSFEYLKKACEVGNGFACKSVAKSYREDIEDPTKQSKVGDYIDMAVERNASSYFVLVSDLYDYFGNHEKDRMPIFKKACLLDKDSFSCKDFSDVLYLHGKGDTKNANKLLALNEYLCSIGTDEGCQTLAEIYTEGKFADKNIDKAFEFSKKVCERRFGKCTDEAGLYLTSSKGKRDKNDKKANVLYEIGCNAEYPNLQACAMLGKNLEKGIGSSIDYEKANMLYSKVCNAKEYDSYQGIACFSLGENFESGLGVEKNIEKANEYYSKACKLRDKSGCISLAFNRETGFGFEQNKQNKEKAESEYKSICSEPYSNCKSIYNYFIESKKNNCKEKGVRTIAAQCEFGSDNFACFLAGLEYGNGENVKPDLEKSNYYYKKGCYAKENYDPSSCTNYGYNLEKGIGIKKDTNKSFDAYKRACSGNYPDEVGCSNLAGRYMDGYGVPRDYVKSLYYAEIACRRNDGRSCGFLAKQYMFGLGTDINYKNSVSNGEKGCELKDSASCNILGVAYEDGKGVKQDYKKAKEYYGKACDLGLQNACDNYAIVNKILHGVR